MLHVKNAHSLINGKGKGKAGIAVQGTPFHTSQLPIISLEYLGSRSGDLFAKVGCLRAEGTREVIREEAGVCHSCVVTTA